MKVKAYLDTKKSVIISSPAGSGKTEKLARRYISLLLDGSEIEKILCITFTEKAAAEMKERILNILEKEDTDLFYKIKEKIPLMRISTIHAFCLKLLKRFSVELGIDPSLDVIDEFNASMLWTDSVYESLMEEKDNPGIFLQMMKERGIKGWNKVYSILDILHEKRPISELLLKTPLGANGIRQYAGVSGSDEIAGDKEKKILALYSKCLKKYRDKKLEKHLVDFDDLELLTYEALETHPEWQNILYSFDEHTDHILVDEFQDTSTLQWKIIDKLTEEWRSGIGAKRSSEKTPTIFFVGDDKQSIYLFRGANAGVFQEAKEKLNKWLGDDYYFEEARDNFRSLPAIIDFTNSLFEKIMPPTLHETWRTKYAEFKATRGGEGRVELVIVGAGENTKKDREKESSMLAKRIRSLIGSYEIYDENRKRPCTYGDMAMLLRKRTHLNIFENALRKEQIPFIVVKGIGFYDEPEVALLREILSFIIDPLDDYSLFFILRSPIFGIDYDTILGLIEKDKRPLIKKLQDDLLLFETYKILNSWIERSTNTPLAILLEEALTETQGWKYFHERQRYANIKKFIKLIETYESSGLSNLAIREKLMKAKDGDEPKANINAEGMNAVKIMTIHAAKGLQFPMVFLPSLDESNIPRSSSIVIDEEENKISMAYEEESSERKKIPIFKRRREKELEEEKRLFYVAVTRARDFVCMSAAHDKEKQPSGRLSYLAESFNLFKDGAILKNDFFDILNEQDIDRLYSTLQPSTFDIRSSKPSIPEQIFTEPVSYEPALRWRDVTEDIDIRITHGEDWVILGKIFHKLFEDISKGILIPERIEERASSLLKNESLTENDIRRLNSIILKDFEGLETSGYLKEIILPRENSFSEMPFILQKGKTIFRGRVDRVIIENNTAVIYDYKTYPVKDEELPLLIEKYRFQIEIYKEAVSKILSMRTKGYLLFTHRGLLVEV
jgi:ATP-dependent helicase/nuclease subunit A